MLDLQTTLILAVAIASVVVVVKRVKGKHQSLPFPPGPKPNVLLGNLLDMPTSKEWLTYEKWGKECGSDIVYANALGNHIVVLNSVEAADELLEKNALTTSGRPLIPMIDLMGLDFNSGFYQPTELWRKHRISAQQAFSKSREPSYQPLQARKIQNLLQSLLQAPENFERHARTLSVAVIMSITYGYDVDPMNDRFVEVADIAIEMASRSVLPGALWVNTIPALLKLPPWFPGTTFYKKGAEIKKWVDQFVNAPFEYVKESRAAGKGEPSIVGNLLEELESKGGVDKQTEERLIRDIGASLYMAGADTTVAATKTFLYAMALYPDVQRKIQAELDSVVGHDRLPEFHDRPNLPYIEATYRELLRWRPVTPLALPHLASEDIVYKGYVVPKGSIIFGNVWAIGREGIEDPEAFKPERYLDENGQLKDRDHAVLTYGFGRRACPGRHLASSTVYITIASVLATFDISLAKDENGKTITLSPDAYTNGMISHPESFVCSITPRSQQAVQLINDGWIEKE